MLISLEKSNGIVTNAVNHKHETWEISVNTFGSGTSIINKKEYQFTEGTIICIPPHLPHIKITKEGFKDYYMHVDKFLNISPGKIPDEPFVLQDDSEHTLEKLMSVMLNILYSDTSNRRTYLNSLCQICQGLIGDWLDTKKSDPAVNRIQNLLLSSYADPELDLNRLLSSIGYNPEYLRQKFKAEIGVTPLEYLTNLRINHAKNLLLENKLHMSIKDISSLCGFYDSHYFSASFKKITGMSPREYALQAVLIDNPEYRQEQVVIPNE